ncbi:MAG: hypothetical protein KDA61_10560, partial [Planctomycetales bacterium]|nr:hypothetical protein [Planctomycetales bacterium]
MPFYIVGLGASAGGLEAIEHFFHAMPPDSGMAFVVVQHLSPDFKSLMGELLARRTDMAIHRVEHGMLVEPDAIYLIPPKKDMRLSQGRLLLSDQNPAAGLNLPIDVFFRSLAEDAGKRAIAIVLSGTGSDGSRGVVDVHEAGGLVVVQEVESAAFDGMPRNALASQVADVVVAPTIMPERLLQYVADPDAFARGQREQEPLTAGNEQAFLFRLFSDRFGIDFTQYRSATIQRRIERRMALRHCENLADYVRTLERDGREADLLYRDLLVEVTHFFRDPQAFERLRRDVIPGIVENAGPRGELRVWVPACATGEEAYSLAMLFDEAARNLQWNPTIKVFATDVHKTSLEVASMGVYGRDAVSHVPPEFREQHLTRRGDLYHVSRELRQSVIFAMHDITRDPPFTNVDLLSCRNVLIYLEPEVQHRVLSVFHFGLKADGTLMLGPSESVGDLAREFHVVDQHWRIFRKLRDVRLPDAMSISLAPALNSVVRQPLRFVEPPASSAAAAGVERNVMEKLLDKYVPPSFLVSGEFELLHAFGDARRFLVQPKGRATLDVLKMVEGDLRIALSGALQRARRDRERVVVEGVPVHSGEGRRLMKVSVEPYEHRDHQLLLVSVEEAGGAIATPEPTGEAFAPGEQSLRRISDLEQELAFAKQSLQSTVEELESSNEELQSTNEE